MSFRAGLLIALLVPSAGVAQSDSVSAATAAYEQKDYATCGDMFRRLGHQTAKRSLLYNAACCFALAGNKDAALELLDEVVRAGWSNTKDLRQDPDLESLRDDERWNGVIAQSEANWTKTFGDTNRELWAIREADEADRQSENVDVKAAIERDRTRLDRVKEIIATGGLKTATDYFIAAMIHQHGSTSDDYRGARRLALRAAELDPSNRRATWLAAAAQDRYLWSIGKPQVYGTQFKQTDGVWTLEPIDQTTITDEDRARWNVPPLAEAKRRAEEMNRKK